MHGLQDKLKTQIQLMHVHLNMNCILKYIFHKYNNVH